MHVCEDPCEDIAIRLPITPSPPTSSSSCCPSRDSSGLGSTRSGPKVIGSVNVSICLHSEAGTVKSPVELHIQHQHLLLGRETWTTTECIARLQDGQRQVVTDLLAMYRYELYVSGQRALGIDVVEEHDPAREVLPQSRTVAHHGEGSEAPRVIEVFLTPSAHGKQLLWQQ